VRKKNVSNRSSHMSANLHRTEYISFVLTRDAAMKSLNKEVFGQDVTTDVISFPMNEDVNDTTYTGEIVVNQDEVLRNAKTYGVTYEQELARVIAHGVLHLVGYDDDTRQHKAAMTAVEDSVIAEI